MTRTRKTRKIGKGIMFARIAILTIIASLLAMFVMGCYTIAIAVEAKIRTLSIAQAYDDAAGYHPSYKQEYIDTVYEEEDARRQEVYERNAYTKWYFNTLESGLARLGIILAWLALPVAVTYIVAWDCYKEKQKAK